jgi:c-di-GMP-binding flagellar brake protein YcgR
MENPNKSPQNADAGLGDYSKYLIHSKTEIIFVLRAVMQKTELVTAYFNHGKDFFLTSILEVEPDHVILDYGSNDALNRKVLASGKVVFLTSQDRVRVQFTAPRVEKVTYGQRDAFKIALPDAVLKLQRREYYRISTPITTPLRCEVPLPQGGRVEVSIVDISVGGIGIIGYPPELEIQVGATYPGCRVDLPDIGTIVATVQVRNLLEVTLKSGQTTKRSGCQFLDLPPNMQVLLQRYIIRLERERRAKLADG